MQTAKNRLLNRPKKSFQIDEVLFNMTVIKAYKDAFEVQSVILNATVEYSIFLSPKYGQLG